MRFTVRLKSCLKAKGKGKRGERLKKEVSDKFSTTVLVEGDNNKTTVVREGVEGNRNQSTGVKRK